MQNATEVLWNSLQAGGRNVYALCVYLHFLRLTRGLGVQIHTGAQTFTLKPRSEITGITT